MINTYFYKIILENHVWIKLLLSFSLHDNQMAF